MVDVASLSGDELIKRAEKRIRKREASLKAAKERLATVGRQVREEAGEMREDECIEAAQARVASWLARMSEVKAEVTACEEHVTRETAPLRTLLSTYRDARDNAKRRRLEAPPAAEALAAAQEAHEQAVRDEASWSAEVAAAVSALGGGNAS